MTKEVIEKLDAIVSEQAQKSAEAIQATEAKVQESLDKLSADVKEQVAALEAKVASINIVKTVGEKSVVADVNRRVKEGMKSMLTARAGKDMTIEFFESEAQAQAFLNEASALTGSGLNVGGRRDYDVFFRQLRQANPLRGLSRTIATTGSEIENRVKTGNAGVTWGYPVQNNGAATTEATAVWRETLQDLNAQFPVRTAFLDDADGAESMIVTDMLAEFAQVEGRNMIQTIANGPHALKSYVGTSQGNANGASVVASLDLSTAGNHTISTQNAATVAGGAVGTFFAVTTNDLVNTMHLVPNQYWTSNMTWMISPTFLGQIRNLKDSQGAPIFDRMNTLTAEGYIGTLLGYPVVVNQFLDSAVSTGAGTNTYVPLYFGDFQTGHNIVDRMNMVLHKYDQTQPGFLTFYGEKRVTGYVRDPAALAALRYIAA